MLTWMSSTEVRAWSMATSAVPPSTLLAFLDALAPWERERADAFVHPLDRREYICAHALRRALLSDCFGLPARAWHFEHHRPHKPIVTTVLHPGRAECNLTHTRGFVAAVAAQDRAVGIDAEKRDRPIEQDLAPWICSPRELAQLQATLPEPADRRETLLRTWVRKEALVKAVGLGLSLPLASLDLDPSGRLSLPAPVAELGPAGAWRVWNIDAVPSHLVAVAAHCAQGRTPAQTHRNLDWRDLALQLTSG